MERQISCPRPRIEQGTAGACRGWWEPKPVNSRWIALRVPVPRVAVFAGLGKQTVKTDLRRLGSAAMAIRCGRRATAVGDNRVDFDVRPCATEGGEPVPIYKAP